MERVVKEQDNVRRSIEAVYREKRGRLFALAFSILNDGHSAEDVLQEAFMKAIERCGSYEERGKMYNYIVRLLYNCAIDKLRKKKEYPTEDETLEGHFQEQTLDEQSAVLEAARNLPDEQRDVIFLRHYSGLSFAEIAEVLDAPLGTILSRMRYGLMKLKTLLERV
jgi:RNA polymerase sigma-70 factor (ECF subfamily)